MTSPHLPRTTRPVWLMTGAAALALLGAASVASADDALDQTGAASESGTTRRVFVPEDFARFAPRTALDMARQIPGFSIREGDGARGLGQADTNVIVNGRRISGKSNGPVDALGRIPADDVVRLELVDGASLDIGGLTGQVLNVVTSGSGRITGQFRLAPQFRSRGTPARWGDASIAIAGGGDKTQWTLALENDQDRRGDDGPEMVFDGAGTLIELREEGRIVRTDQPRLSGSYARIADNGNVLNVTGEIGGVIQRDEEVSARAPVAAGVAAPVESVRLFQSSEDEFNYELGADYQFGFGPGRLKLIGYHRFENSPTRSATRTSFTDGRADQGSLFTRNADEGETIARGEYSFGGLGGDLLLAAEGVRNYLDIDSTLAVRDAAGMLQPAALAGASARVDEDRADLSLTYSRALVPGLQFQASGGGEYSRISQSGAFGQTRTFYRPKGFVALDWKASDRLSLSGRIERVVGQLNFFDFIASVDLNDETANVTNASLVPQQSWRVEAEANIGLGALGSVSLRPFYEDISDIVDLIPIAGGGQAPGNLPSATRYGIDGDVTVLSEGLGWAGTRFDATLSIGRSSVRDPLTGIAREISDSRLGNVNLRLRHDIQGTDWALGSSVFWNEDAPNVRLDEISQRTETFGFVQAFVENKDIAGLTVRAEIANLVNRENRFDRTVFTDRAGGSVAFIEDRNRKFGTIFTIEIEGSF